MNKFPDRAEGNQADPAAGCDAAAGVAAGVGGVGSLDAAAAGSAWRADLRASRDISTREKDGVAFFFSTGSSRGGWVRGLKG